MDKFKSFNAENGDTLADRIGQYFGSEVDRFGEPMYTVKSISYSVVLNSGGFAWHYAIVNYK